MVEITDSYRAASQLQQNEKKSAPEFYSGQRRGLQFRTSGNDRFPSSCFDFEATINEENEKRIGAQNEILADPNIYICHSVKSGSKDDPNVFERRTPLPFRIIGSRKNRYHCRSHRRGELKLIRSRPNQKERRQATTTFK